MVGLGVEAGGRSALTSGDAGDLRCRQQVERVFNDDDESRVYHR